MEQHHRGKALHCFTVAIIPERGSAFCDLVTESGEGRLPPQQPMQARAAAFRVCREKKGSPIKKGCSLVLPGRTVQLIQRLAEGRQELF